MKSPWDEQTTKRGERCSNTHFEHRFTCPHCLTDHEVYGIDEENPKTVRCECGAPLRLELEFVPEAKCTIADKDEEEDIVDLV